MSKYLKSQGILKFNFEKFPLSFGCFLYIVSSNRCIPSFQVVLINAIILGAKNSKLCLEQQSGSNYISWKSLVRCSPAETFFVSLLIMCLESSSYLQRRNHKTIMKDKQTILKREKKRRFCSSFKPIMQIIKSKLAFFFFLKII